MLNLEQKFNLISGNCQEELQKVPDETVDLICSDPPYALTTINRWKNADQFPQNQNYVGKRFSKGFMGKKWDVLPTVEILKECLRTLKSGAFSFWLMTPRQDSHAEFLVRLKKAGFIIGFSPIFWTYASGFPKANNISKSIDKRLGVEREIVGVKNHSTNFENAKKNKTGYLADEANKNNKKAFGYGAEEITIPKSDLAKQFDGAFAGFQPKPAIEIIVVAMKPLSEKTYVEQALKNGKGVTWLGNCRIPCSDADKNQDRVMIHSENGIDKGRGMKERGEVQVLDLEKGRFPANLLVEDDILNDGEERTSGYMSPILHKRVKTNKNDVMGVCYGKYNNKDRPLNETYGDSGSFSRYFSLDAWYEKNILSNVKKLPKNQQKIFPFLIVPKASGSEKNKGMEEMPLKKMEFDSTTRTNKQTTDKYGEERKAEMQNNHATVKPEKLMDYLCILGSRPNDLILDPFMGSGTTGVAALSQNRRFLGIEMEPNYFEIAKQRISIWEKQTRLFE